MTFTLKRPFRKQLLRAKFLEGICKMNPKPKKSNIYKIKERFILFLPTTYADDLNRASRSSLKIYLNKDMKSGRVIVNETMLYATMLNTTCVNENNQNAPKNAPKVLVCHEQKFKKNCPLINNYFSIKAVVKKRNQNRDVPEPGGPVKAPASSSTSGYE